MTDIINKTDNKDKQCCQKYLKKTLHQPADEDVKLHIVFTVMLRIY